MLKLTLGVVLICSTVVLAAACSSTDASPDAGTAGTNDGGTGTGDASVPDSGDLTATYCAARAAYGMRCDGDAGTSAACFAARAAQCSQSVALESRIIQEATLKCESAASPCGAKATTPCFEAEFAKAVPTATQAALRDRVCTLCGGGSAAVDQCKKDFFFNPAAGGIGAGFSALLSNDTVVMKMDTQCALANDAGANLCQSDFFQCSGDVYSNAQPTSPAACKK
jgi:hypothetical protein